MTTTQTTVPSDTIPNIEDLSLPEALRATVYKATHIYIATPCPDWCTSPAFHPATGGDNPEGGFRVHGDVRFGKYIHGFANEYVSAPGVLEAGVELYAEDGVDLDPDQLRQLSADALGAAQWLEAQA